MEAMEGFQGLRKTLKFLPFLNLQLPNIEKTLKAIPLPPFPFNLEPAYTPLMPWNRHILILCTSFSKEEVASNFVNEFVKLSLERICWTSIALFFFFLKIMCEEKLLKKFILLLAELYMPHYSCLKLWEFLPYKIIHMTLEHIDPLPSTRK